MECYELNPNYPSTELVTQFQEMINVAVHSKIVIEGERCPMNWIEEECYSNEEFQIHAKRFVEEGVNPLAYYAHVSRWSAGNVIDITCVFAWNMEFNQNLSK